MSHETLARAVRRAHIAYSDELIAAIRARVPVETLLSWGIPWADIDQVLYRKGRTHGPTSRCSCGHAEEQYDGPICPCLPTEEPITDDGDYDDIREALMDDAS